MRPVKTGDSFASLLASDSHMEGVLWSPSGVRVEGQLKGWIVTPGKVFISNQSRVEGTVVCGELICGGVVEGRIYSMGKVMMNRQSCVNGTIHARLFENESNERMICSVHILTEQTIEGIRKVLSDHVTSENPMADKRWMMDLAEMFELTPKPPEMIRVDPRDIGTLFGP